MTITKNWIPSQVLFLTNPSDFIIAFAIAFVIIPDLVVKTVVFYRANATTQIFIPNLFLWACLLWLVTDAIAELVIPVEATKAVLGLALTRARFFVPNRVFVAIHRPPALALTRLPVKIHVVDAVNLTAALAFATDRVPLRAKWARHVFRANAVACSMAEYTGLDTLNSLLAFTLTSIVVPFKRRLAVRFFLLR